MNPHENIAMGNLEKLEKDDLLVLDEPTAALDPIAENNMYQSFRKIMGKKGTIMISHRLASSKISDRILVVLQHIC